MFWDGLLLFGIFVLGFKLGCLIWQDRNKEKE
jgi:hypothetical protein